MSEHTWFRNGSVDFKGGGQESPSDRCLTRLSRPLESLATVSKQCVFIQDDIHPTCICECKKHFDVIRTMYFGRILGHPQMYGVADETQPSTRCTAALTKRKYCIQCASVKDSGNRRDTPFGIRIIRRAATQNTTCIDGVRQEHLFRMPVVNAGYLVKWRAWRLIGQSV